MTYRVMSHPATYEDVDRAVKRAFELFPLDIRGRKVLIKPNVLRTSKAEEGIVTHPAVLRAVVETVEAMGPASLVVGDNPGLFNYGANEECFRATGLMDAAKGYYRNIGSDSTTVPFDPSFMPSVNVSTAVLDADVVISLPKFKTHGLTVISGAIKNSYGILPGAQKARLHKAAGNPAGFHDLIVDVFKLRVPDLFIVDAVVGMEGNGPASPDLRDVGLVLASDNGVALDSIIAVMMGCEPGRLGFLRKAAELGLGDWDPGAIEVIGELRRLPDFKLPPLSGEANFGNQTIQEMIHSRTVLKPRVDRDACIGCARCVEHCAAQALSMDADGFPALDADSCITCFCCQEMCPEKAIVLK